MFKKFFGGKSDKNIGEDYKINLNVTNINNYNISHNLTNDIVSIMKIELDKSKLHVKDIPEKIINNIVNIYGIDRYKIIAFYDTTIFNSGKDGMLLCDEFIGLKHAFEKANIIRFDELVIGSINIVNKKLRVNDKVINLGTDEFRNTLKKIKEILILQDSKLKSIYDNYVVNKFNEIESNINNNEFNTAETNLNNLEEVIISGKDYYSKLYCYGITITMSQLRFEQSYEYLYKLEELNELDNKKITDLKYLIDKNKLEYEFNILNDKKNRFIEQNEFDNAIDTVYEQNTLNIKPYEELNKEIIKIKELKQHYIKSLEEKVEENLKYEKYNDTLDILKELNKINPNNLYEEYYITAKIGIYEFEDVEKKIREIKESNEELALKLEQKLIVTRDEVSKKIRKAVKEKNYEIFEKDNNLRYAKDIWCMPPIMHFILNKDIEGVRILANTFEYFELDRNVVGHTILNLIPLHLGDSFCTEALGVLDKNLQNLNKKYNKNYNWSKFGKLAIAGLDEISQGYFTYEANTMKSKIDNSLNEFELKIKNYILDKLEENHEELIEYLVKPYDFSEELYEKTSCKNELEIKLTKLKKEKYEIENSIDKEINIAVNNKLEEFLDEAAIIELGERDEFETTAEYNERKRLKVEEIRTSYIENNYIKDRIFNLEKEVKENIMHTIATIEDSIKEKSNEYEITTEYIDTISYLLNCKSKTDINNVISYYYDVYKSNIEIGSYDADSETFNINANGNESKVRVKRSIAKDFKENFSNLNPIYSRDIIKSNKEYKIQHYFTYEYKHEKIKILFMTNIIQ